MPHNVDKIVGATMRQIRKSKGISQQELGDHLGISFQQVQKYEKGMNRISASTLFETANFLEVKVQDLFHTLVSEKDLGGDITGITRSLIDDPEVRSLIHNFSRIKDEKMRAAIINLAKGMGERSP